MGMFEKLFPRQTAAKQADAFFQTLTAYQPSFTSWNGKIYESDLVRAAIDAKARHIAKLQVHSHGSGKPGTRNALKIAPNEWQTWSQWLYQTSTILDVQTTCIIVPIRDVTGRTIGIYSVLPSTCKVREYKGVPYLAFEFPTGKRASVEMKSCGILTRYQYGDAFFGSGNDALNKTMNLINMQNQGITEGIKNAATFRFMARVSNFTKPDDLTKEQSRFNRSQMQGESGGIVLFPNTYSDIKEISNAPFVVDDKQLSIIQSNVFRYFGVNEAILTNSADGTQLDAFWNGALEPFSVQLADVLTRMIFSDTEIRNGNKFVVTSDRLQYMSVQNKINMAVQLGDRGFIMIDEVRNLFNLEPLPDGQGQKLPIRGEYYMLNEDETPDEPKQDKSESEAGQESNTIEEGETSADSEN